ncbi:MAG: META domain-containing protein [Pseudomonadota bacterium]
MKTLFAAAVTLASLATPALAQRDAPYRAAGTEPFWSLTIDARTMKFEAPGARSVTVPTPKVIHGFAGEIYQTRRIGVNTVHKACSDGMSDRTYPDTVQVTVDGRRYEGCGGTPAGEQARSAIDGSWRIETIAGRPAVRGTSVTVAFNGTRMNGNTGCNSFSGNYRLDRGFLSAGPLITTRRACTRFTNAQEQSLLGLFGQRLSVSSTRNGKLVMTGRGGTLVLARAPARR